jgi:hypothetical protein
LRETRPVTARPVGPWLRVRRTCSIAAGSDSLRIRRFATFPVGTRSVIFFFAK